LARVVLPAPLGALGAVLAPAHLVSGLLGRASLGVIVAFAVWLILREVGHALTWGGPIADQYRDAIEHELTKKLGVVAPPVQVFDALAKIAPFPEVAAPAIGMVSPSCAPSTAPGCQLRAALSITLISVGAVVAIAMFRRFTEPGPAPPPLAALTA